MKPSDLKGWLRGGSRKLVIVLAVCALVLAAALLWIGGFGFRYLGKTPVSLDALSASELEGSYVTVAVPDLGSTFAYFGYQDESGNTVVDERFSLFLAGDQYLIVRVPAEFVPLLERYDSADELVESGQVGSLLEVNFGSLTGSVNSHVQEEVLGLLRSWLTTNYIDAETLTDELNGADLSAYAGAADGDYSAYLDAVILPYMMEAGYMGAKPAGTVKTTAALALVFLLIAAALLVTLPAGVWEKALRKAAKDFGWTALEEDFGAAQMFGSALSIGSRFIWLRDKRIPRFLQTPDVIWAYPRSKRLEGGKKLWSLVLKTADGREEAVLLREEVLVEKAAAVLTALGNPLTLGYDEEKQKLYEKDLPGFVGRVRNGKL